MDSLLILLITSIILIIIWYIFFNQKHSDSNLPGPYQFPIIGYLPFLNPKTPYKTLHDLSTKYGKIYQIKLGSINTVVLSDAGLIRDAFRRDEFTARAPLYITHGIMGGYGLICAEGPLWKDQRRQTINWLKLLGMSKFSKLRSIFENRIETGVNDLLETLRINSKKNLVFNPMNALHHSMGNILNDFVFGIKYSKDDSTWKYLQNLQEEGVKYIGVSGVVNFLPILRFLPSNKKIINFLLDGKTKTHAIYNEIIKKCLEHLNDNDSEYPDCILKYFLCERENRLKTGNSEGSDFFSDNQLKHLLADLFGAGVDTTLATLRWFILYMAKNENIQKLLRLELKKLTSNDIIKFDDLEKIDYLKACIAETQRIRSVVPLGIPHGTVKNTFIGGYKIERNSMIIPLQWAIHMDKNIWKNPENFDPNRFMAEDGKYQAHPDFIPFQTGKRMCPGDDLAKILLYMFAGNLIHQFEIKMIPFENVDFDGECGITLTPPDCSFIFIPIA